MNTCIRFRRIGNLSAGLSAAAMFSFASGCNNAGEGALSGAAIGAGAGAIIGSFTGNAGMGAAIGAVGGALAGGVTGDQNERRERYRYYEYDRCR